MNRIIPLLLLAALLYSCGSSKSFLERNDQDKALQDAVKKLNNKSTDEDALAAVPILYADIVKSHLAKIQSYNVGKDVSRWDKIISEYQYLQSAYNSIINSTPAFKLVNPQNFSVELLDAKQQAAEENYNLGQSFLVKQGRENAKKAYSYFTKSNKLVAGFKDVQNKINESYNSTIVNVVVNPIIDNSYFNNNGWGMNGYNYSNEYFQQSLVRDLQNLNNNSRYAARFFSDYEIRRENIPTNWAVDLRLRDIDIPSPRSTTSSRNLSAQVRSGTDTSGNPIYKTVYATLNVTRSSFTAKATMEVNITDVQSRKNVSFRTFRDDYRWEEEWGSYTGDSRALSNNDWAILNNNNNRNGNPRREDILAELYKKIYPQVKNNIINTVSW